jgi:hypothetical protein
MPDNVTTSGNSGTARIGGNSPQVELEFPLGVMGLTPQFKQVATVIPQVQEDR